jgi:hypothetical protein
MRETIDELALYLAGVSSLTPLPALDPSPSTVTWIIGDVGMGAPQGLPFGYIAPFNDKLPAYSAGGSSGPVRGVDMEAATIPLLIVLDEHDYSPPVPSVINPVVLEQPGYRPMMNLVENILTALRRNITLGGVAATSTITEARYVLVDIASKKYRGCRMTLSVTRRRPR